MPLRRPLRSTSRINSYTATNECSISDESHVHQAAHARQEHIDHRNGRAWSLERTVMFWKGVWLRVCSQIYTFTQLATPAVRVRRPRRWSSALSQLAWMLWF